MSCSLELLNWFEGCHNKVEPQTKPLQLTANWAMLPPDVVDIILDLLKQINFEFYVNNFQRIDITRNVVKRCLDCWTPQDMRWSRPQIKVVNRFVGTPPCVDKKYITKEILQHKQTLPYAIKEISNELEKRKQKSVDGNIKPSKMRCKYIKNIQNWVLKSIRRDIHAYSAASAHWYTKYNINTNHITLW